MVCYSLVCHGRLWNDKALHSMVRSAFGPCIDWTNWRRPNQEVLCFGLLHYSYGIPHEFNDGKRDPFHARMYRCWVSVISDDSTHQQHFYATTNQGRNRIFLPSLLPLSKTEWLVIQYVNTCKHSCIFYQEGVAVLIAILAEKAVSPPTCSRLYWCSVRLDLVEFIKVRRNFVFCKSVPSRFVVFARDRASPRLSVCR